MLLCLIGLVATLLLGCDLTDPDPDPPIVPPPLPPDAVAFDTFPAWSPDGRTIAYRRFVWSSQGPPGIYFIDPDGTDNRLIIDEATFGQPVLLLQELRFSPDGTKLAFALNLEVFILDLDTLALQQLTHTGANAKSPDWSPDGMRIVYSRPLAPGGLYIIDLKSEEDRQLFADSHPLFGGTPRWSPRGEPIVFWAGADSGLTLDIFSAHSDGTNFRRLTNSGLDAFTQYPRWIDGGDRILYTWRSDRDPTSEETRVMQADGSEQSPWPIHLYNSSAISPDSRAVVLYGLQPGSGDSLAVLFTRGIDDVAGTSLRQLTSYQPPTPHWQVITTAHPYKNTEVLPWLAARSPSRPSPSLSPPP